MTRRRWSILALVLTLGCLPPRDAPLGEQFAVLRPDRPSASVAAADGRDGASRPGAGATGPVAGAQPPTLDALGVLRPQVLVSPLAPSASSDPLLSAFAGRDADVRDVLALLFAGGGLDHVVAGDVRGRVSFDIHATTRAEAFLELLRHVGLSMTVADGRVVVSSRERRRFDVSALAVPGDELVVGLRSLLDPHGYGVRLPDGRLEVEASATAMAHVVAWLDGQALPAAELPYRLSPEGPPRPASISVATHGRLGRRELAQALARRGLTDVLAGRPVSAARRLADARALDESLPLAHLAEGLLHLRAGSTAAARPALDRAVAARPDDRLALTLRALDDLLEGRHDTALSTLRQVHARWDDAHSANNLASALFLAGQDDRALAVTRSDDGATPGSLHVLRAWLLARADWVEAAAAELEVGLAQGVRVDDEACALVLRGLDLLRQGQVVAGPPSGAHGAPPGDVPPAAEDEAAEDVHGVRDRYDADWH